MNPVAFDWFDRIPKAELHVHMEGAIPVGTLRELIVKYEGKSEAPSLEELQQKFTYRDFPHFIEIWIWKNNYLREYEDFSFIAKAFARDLVSQNILYAEAFCSPGDFARHGLESQEIVTAIRNGLNQIPKVEVSLVPDLIRDFGPEAGMETLLKLSEVLDQGVIGIGIGGSEQDFPPEPWTRVYEKARSLGLHTSAHAGEAAGPQSVWGAIDILHVDRIGHGTRAIEDPRLMEEIARRRVPVEMCPLSNLRTRVVHSIREHPLPRFMEFGIPVTVNTDDPVMFNNTLAQEYRTLAKVHGFDRGDIIRLVRNAVETSWLAPDIKKTKWEQFETLFAKEEKSIV